MPTPRLVTSAGLTINMAEVKCFRLSDFDYGKNTLIVEFKTRYDYLRHPQTGAYEKQEYNESTEMGFPTYESAALYRDELVALWQDYLDDHG
jgi:hypothetical protein